MTAGPIGINLAGTLGYVDVMKETRPWTNLSGGTVATDANGWPLADAQIVVLDERVNQSFNGPDPNAVQPDIGGTYSLSFTGQATVTPDFLNNYTVQNVVYNPQTNTTTASLVVAHNSPALLIVDFRNTVDSASSTGAGVANVKLIQPGYAANTTQVFTTNMISALAPFSTLRYLNTDQANSYGPTYDSNGNLIPLNWSQRKLPSAASQTSGPGAAGESWEDMVAFANATNTDMWINIPGSASNSYVTSLANLIKYGDTVNGVTYAGLNANLKVNFEVGNEVWGGSYLPYAYNQAAAKQEVAAGGSALNNDGSTDPNVWAQRYYLERTMQVTNIFRSVFGADPTYSEIRPILGWQEGDWQYYTSTFPWFEQTFGAPNTFFYGMGNANYADPTDYSSVNKLINSLNANLPQQYATTADFTTVANYYGLQNVAYEGGPSTGSGVSTAAQGQVALAADRDPRMETYMDQLYTTWYSAGGGLAEVYDGPFDNIGPYNQYALAEVAQEGNPTASPKYQGIVDLTQAGPTAVTAGVSVSSTASTSLSLTSDSLGQRTLYSVPGQVNDWLLNVPTAGTYSLVLQTQGGAAVGQLSVNLSDTNKVGTYLIEQSGTSPIGIFTLHAGLNSLAITTLSAFAPTSLTLAPVTNIGPVLNDPGFEYDQAVPGNAGYIYNPSLTPWTFLGETGVTGNGSAFTNSNPAAPQGNQVAFLQNQGTISQTATNFAAASYHLSFSLAARANNSTLQTIQVLIDGTVVGSYSPTNTSYQTISTPSVALSAGSHTITFKGLNVPGDATDFIDNVTITQDLSAVMSGPSVSDPSFEATALPPGGSSYVYDPTGGAWAFNPSSGVSQNNSAFTYANPAAPAGSQVAFIQNTGAISQTVNNFLATSYQISVAAAVRAGFAKQTFEVLVDGTVVGTFAPTSSTYQTFLTSPFTVTAGSHTIAFQGMNVSGDATDFLDSVSLTQQSNTPPAAITDGGFEGTALPPGGSSYFYDPTGGAWIFNPNSGVSQNNSAFTAANPAAPQGSQVAFIQNTGSITQTVNNFTAGNESITFQADQRINYASQTIEVLVDGVVISTFTPTTGAYQSLQTAIFAVTAGSHIITFQGMNTVGDATDFIDNVALVSH